MKTLLLSLICGFLLSGVSYAQNTTPYVLVPQQQYLDAHSYKIISYKRAQAGAKDPTSKGDVINTLVQQVLDEKKDGWVPYDSLRCPNESLTDACYQVLVKSNPLIN